MSIHDNLVGSIYDFIEILTNKQIIRNFNFTVKIHV